MDVSPTRSRLFDPEIATPPPRSSASYASSGGLPPFFDQDSSGVARIVTPGTSNGDPTPVKEGPEPLSMQSSSQTSVFQAEPSRVASYMEPPPLIQQRSDVYLPPVQNFAEGTLADPSRAVQEDDVEPSVPSLVSMQPSDHDRQQTPSALQGSQTSTGDTTSSEVSPFKEPTPPEHQLFSVTGRPARNASVKKVVYSVGWDKDGNPVKSADEKQQEKQRKEEEKARKAAERQEERQRKVEEKEAEKARKAAEREAKKAAKTGSSADSSSISTEHINAEASASDITTSSNAATASGSASGSPPIRSRSGRQITAPVDRHRSSIRDEKAAARRQKAAALAALEDESSDDDDDDEHDEEEERPESEQVGAADNRDQADESDQHIPSDQTVDSAKRAPRSRQSTGKGKGKRKPPEMSTAETGKVQGSESDDELDLLRPSEHEDEEAEEMPTRSTKRARQSSGRSEVVVEVASKRARKLDHASSGRHESPDKENTVEEEQEENAPAPSTTTTQLPTLPAPSRSNSTPKTSTPRPNLLTPSSTSTSSPSIRRSFSGTPLSSLLSTNPHRRPGLGNKKFIPPLHPNRKPPPPPKFHSTLSKKDKDQLAKEQKKREADGTDSEDEDGSDEENKRKFNPFEEEIEGY
ncbi:unnamed protein product [Sympodiomycopsis kandeliae]